VLILELKIKVYHTSNTS